MGSDAFAFVNSKGVTYYLHCMDVTLKNKRTQRIYFFARNVRNGFLTEVPAGYVAVETKKTGMPVLKKA